MTLGSARLGGARRGLAALELKWLPLDSAVWFIAVVGATWARYDFDAMPSAGDVVIFALGAVLVNALVGLAVGIYLRRYVLGSFEEAAALAVSAILATFVLIGGGFLQNPVLVPRSVPVFAGAFAVVGVWGVRYLGRGLGVLAAATSSGGRTRRGLRCRLRRGATDPPDAFGSGGTVRACCPAR